MSTQTTVSIVLFLDSPSGARSAGTLTRIEWTKRERTVRAIKAGLVTWGAAVFCAFIPILHFFLVPALLILGPFIALISLGVPSAIMGGHGTCPKCQAPFEIAKSSDRWPLKDTCTRCQASVKIEKSGSGPHTRPAEILT